MAYGNALLVTSVLANALVSNTPDATSAFGNLINVGSTLDNNLVTTAIINVFLQDASQRIDSTLDHMYGCPLNRVCDLDMTPASNASPADTTVSISSDMNALGIGDNLLFYDSSTGNREEVIVSAIAGNLITFTPALANSYLSATSLVKRVDFPAAIRFIASRWAAANIYDKYFAAQADKNESQFGKHLRELADNELDKILMGLNSLPNQFRTGHISVHSNLFKPYQTPEGWNKNPAKIPRTGRS